MKRNIIIGIILSFMLFFTFTNLSYAKYTYQNKYDENNRLITTSIDGWNSIEYVYDDNGNLIATYEIPTHLQASNITETKATITWNGVSNAVGYKVYVNGEFIGDVVALSYTITNLLPGRTYEISIRAVTAERIGAYSTPIKVKTLAQPPTIDVNLKSKDWTKDNITVTVSANDDYGIKEVKYLWTNTTTKPTSGWQSTINSIFSTTQSNEGTWYLHIEALDLDGQSIYKYYGPYKIDKTPSTFKSIKINGATYVNGTSYYIPANKKVTIQVTYFDNLSGAERTYLRLYGSGTSDIRSYVGSNGTYYDQMNSSVSDIDITSGRVISNDGKTLTVEFDVESKTESGEFIVYTYNYDKVFNSNSYRDSGYDVIVDTLKPNDTNEVLYVGSPSATSVFVTFKQYNDPNPSSGHHNRRLYMQKWVGSSYELIDIDGNGTKEDYKEIPNNYTSYTVNNLAPGTKYRVAVIDWDNVNNMGNYEYIYFNMDTYEPNDTFAQARIISLEKEYQSYISRLGNRLIPSDIDYFKVYITESKPRIKVSLNVPSYKDYDLYLYSSSGALLASSENGIGMNESISKLVGSGYYYIKITGGFNSYSYSSPYKLYVSSELVNPYPEPNPYPCPPGGICFEPTITISLESEALSVIEPIKDKQSVYEALNDDNLENRMEAYDLLAENGTFDDLVWLSQRKDSITEEEERKYIQWTIAKLGYKTSRGMPQKELSYLSTVLDFQDEEIRQWLKDKLVELIGDEKKVEKWLNEYDKEKQKEKN